MFPVAGVVTPPQPVTGPLAVLFALLTQFGDLWVLFSAVALIYWLDAVTPRIGRTLDRERTALVVALFVGAITLLETLKPFFAVPRPPGFGVAPPVAFLPELLAPMYEWMATASGYGFPSGHALASTVVWGGVAWAVRVGRPRTRAAVAGVLVTLVAASRVFLGVHYPVDVVFGTIVGLAYLAVVLGLLRDPGRAFVLATAIGLVALGVAVSTEAVGAAGFALGLTVTWYWLGEELLATPPTRTGALTTAALGLLVVGPVLLGAVSLHLPTVLVAVVAAAGGGLVLALPLAGERLAPEVRDRIVRSVGSS